MARRSALYLVALSLLALLSACSPWWIKPLPLTGDERVLSLDNSALVGEILGEYNVNAFAALIVATDGTAARIGRDSFDNLLLHRRWKGWLSYSADLSPTCNLVGLHEVCLQTATPAPRFEVMESPDEARAWSAFGLKLHEFARQGAAERNGYAVVKYSRTLAGSPWSWPMKAVATSDDVMLVSADTLRISDMRVMAGADTLTALWREIPNDIRGAIDRLAERGDHSKLLICVVDGLTHPMVDHMKALGVKLPIAINLPPASVVHAGDDDIFRALQPGDYVVTPAPLTLPTGVRRTMVNQGGPQDDIDAFAFEAGVNRMPDMTGALVVHFTGLLAEQHANGPFSDEATAHAQLTLQRIAELDAAWPGRLIVVGRPDPAALDLRHKHFGVWGER